MRRPPRRTRCRSSWRVAGSAQWTSSTTSRSGVSRLTAARRFVTATCRLGAARCPGRPAAAAAARRHGLRGPAAGARARDRSVQECGAQRLGLRLAHELRERLDERLVGRSERRVGRPVEDIRAGCVHLVCELADEAACRCRRPPVTSATRLASPIARGSSVRNVARSGARPTNANDGARRSAAGSSTEGGGRSIVSAELYGPAEGEPRPSTSGSDPVMTARLGGTPPYHRHRHRTHTRRGDTDDHHLQDTHATSLAERLHGSLVRVGDPDYDEARKVYNAMIDKRPGADRPLRRCRRRDRGGQVRPRERPAARRPRRRPQRRRAWQCATTGWSSTSRRMNGVRVDPDGPHRAGRRRLHLGRRRPCHPRLRPGDAQRASSRRPASAA